MNYRKACNLSNILLAAGIVCEFALSLVQLPRVVFYILSIGGAVSFISGIVVMLARYRCPHCGHRMPFVLRPPEKCPLCNKPLD